MKRKKTSHPLFLIFLSWLFLFASPLSASTHVFDSFDDGDRTIQNPPESLAYFCTGPDGALSEKDGQLHLDLEVRGAIVAFLTEPGVYLKLEPGEILALELAFTVRGVTEKWEAPLRFAFLNSGNPLGQPRSMNFVGGGDRDDTYTDFRGYMAMSNFSSDYEGAVAFMKREQPHRSLMAMTNQANSAYTKLGDYGGIVSFEEGQKYTAQFYLHRITSGQIELNAMIVPGSPDSNQSTWHAHHVVDSRDLITEFDTISIGVVGRWKFIPEIVIDSLHVFKVY